MIIDKDYIKNVIRNRTDWNDIKIISEKSRLSIRTRILVGDIDFNIRQNLTYYKIVYSEDHIKTIDDNITEFSERIKYVLNNSEQLSNNLIPFINDLNININKIDSWSMLYRYSSSSGKLQPTITNKKEFEGLRKLNNCLDYDKIKQIRNYLTESDIEEFYSLIKLDYQKTFNSIRFQFRKNNESIINIMNIIKTNSGYWSNYNHDKKLYTFNKTFIAFLKSLNIYNKLINDLAKMKLKES